MAYKQPYNSPNLKIGKEKTMKYKFEMLGNPKIKT